MRAIEAVIEKRVDILPLHANLSSDEQRKVFQKIQSKWKIVCSTNVAEVRHVSCHFLY
jgi:HrpA-like RNA helicase